MARLNSNFYKLLVLSLLVLFILVFILSYIDQGAHSLFTIIVAAVFFVLIIGTLAVIGMNLLKKK
ncbi:hypothetical protein MsAg5_13720 [Methanosarcinaceae archaeon Ag5]|uniref:Uncharacterized protein n=1 Tax=Methanolapillus africanus TaxID=3028297 RepID=A0AAE4SEC7_9EURY|nr:hypothetical protein [Methanosarcinaceae archaeon Ag5]